MVKKLSVYMGQYRRWAVLAPVLVIVEVICEIIMPRLMAAIVDVGIANSDMAYILRVGGVMLALAAVGMFCGVTSAKAASIAGQGFGANLRDSMFRKIQDFSFADIDRFSSGSLITRMTNDVNAIQLTVTMGMRIITRAPVMLIAALAMAASINGRLALVMLVVIPVMVLAIGLIMKVCNHLFEVMQRKIDNLNSAVQENLVAVRVVKAFVRAGYEKTKFKKANDELTDAGIQVAMRIVMIMPVMMLCLNLATLAVLYLGGIQVMDGAMRYGDLSSFLNYIFQILMSVMMVAMSLLQLSRAAACARRIIEVLDTQPDIQDRAERGAAALPPARGEVEFRDVSFKYRSSGSGDDVLSHLSFTMKPGQVTAIVGGTGVGKSSLVNLIPRFYDVTGGSVRVDGVDVRDYPLEELRSRIGMVLQNNVLFSGTIRENLLWGKADATEEELVQAARDAQAYDFIMSFPDGFDTRIDQGGVNVSGGQKQRLCIARAMLKKPAVLILDDSTSAVDSATEAAIRESFAKNLAGTTVIIIAQRISSVQSADQILVLDDGTVAGSGTHAELLQSNAVYQEIYQSQQEGVSE
ncbi:ABC transporter ATP-binding protein [Candidatus Pseudoscillospira sp. SGI.172]|uniref:ABC transporter ATP-binding protein n=1 Tax=Candidatus Pseudoscillospira sp. SGI.172 TaxID=3420582 RepID=UPI002A7A65ED|nr:ABC transporter ATP-binding protein/permease [Pseudoflavonifractor sp.]MDY3019931.1 ABC transporter ATP-binding protein [Oscillospiraceae bacterium]